MRFVRGRWAGVVAAILWPGLPAWGGACTMAHVSRLMLQPSQGNVLVDAQLNGGPAKLIFDTGAATSLLTEAAVERLGLRHMQGEEIRNTLATVSGIGGERTARYVTARQVELGGLHGRDYNFMAADLPMRWADGLLSIDLISQFDIDLDFPESQINLYRPTGDCSAPAAFLAGPLYSVPLEPFGRDRRPRVQVTVNGHRFLALVDTGAVRSAVFRSAAAQIGLQIPAQGQGSGTKAGGIGPVQVASTRQIVPELSVGDLVFEGMPMMVLDEAAHDGISILLGADFQAHVHLWVSYSSGTLIMQYPPKPSKTMSVQ